MSELEFLKEVISEVSHGAHDLVWESDMTGVTVLSRSGGSMIEGDTILKLWNEYKKMVNAEHLALHFVK